MFRFTLPFVPRIVAATLLGLVCIGGTISGDSTYLVTDASALPGGYTLGHGYREPRVFLEAQGHEFPTHDTNIGRHFHVGLSVPRRAAGKIHFDARLTFFHAQGMTFNKLSVTWRGGPGVVTMPMPEKKKGLFRIPITSHEQVIVIPFDVDTTLDPYNGARALELDMAVSRDDGRMAMTRLLAGTIYIDNGRPEFRVNADGTPAMKKGRPVSASVSGKIGAEYWINNTPVTGAPFGYTHVEVNGARLFASDPVTPVNAVGKFRTPERDVRLKIVQNPELHLHPPKYGFGVLPGDPDSPGVEPPWRGTPPKVKWLPAPFIPPSMDPGDRLMVRALDTGKDWSGNVVVPEGAGAALIVITLADN